jgi:signal peptidase I
MRHFRIGFSLAVALIVFALVMLLWLSFMVVDGSSMLPGFPDGSFVAVDRLAYGIRLPAAYLLRWARPRAGQLLVFRNPQDGRLVMKRCLAVEGQRLRLVPGGLAVGGRILPLDPAQSFHFMDSMEVPPACVFVAGDNPPESVDSRDYGCLPIEKIIGKVLLSF